MTLRDCKPTKAPWFRLTLFNRYGEETSFCPSSIENARKMVGAFPEYNCGYQLVQCVDFTPELDAAIKQHETEQARTEQ